MKKKAFIDKLISNLESVPAQADVIELKQPNIDDLHRRGHQLLSFIGKSCGCSFERGDWTEQQDSTLVRLPQGARAVLYHPSGAMQLTTGLAPMEQLFGKLESKAHLTKLVEQSARNLNIKQWVSENEELRFERLWQIKAAAADREGKAISPVLCRAVGAYRHYINGLPVLGAASVAVKVATEGQLDSLSIMARQTSGKTIDRVKTVPPEQALQKVYQQLERLMGHSKIPLTEVAMPQSVQFGYLSLSKRKAQRLLEPAYVVSINIEGQEEAQGYVFTVAGSDSPYMPLALVGNEAITSPKARYGMTTAEERERIAAC
ncbi:MAG: hypothetical protein HY272_10690 [Gammaproteobacteria bacterium]|nr:hypothetical protein [Gammaproteobacteria bacterium]